VTCVKCNCTQLVYCGVWTQQQISSDDGVLLLVVAAQQSAL